MSEPFESMTLHVAACVMCRRPVTAEDTWSGHVRATLSLDTLPEPVSLLVGWHHKCGSPWKGRHNDPDDPGYFGQWEPWMGAQVFA